MKSQRHRALLAGLLAGLSACAARAAEAPTGLQQDVTFSQYAAQAAATQLLQRLLSPLAAGQIERTLTQSKQQLREEPLDLAVEKFTLYVPARAPPEGYALLVFIPPWPQARVPAGWPEVLERSGTIFVTAAHSGNETEDLGRRAPLALLAAANLRRLYSIDPARVYVGGFSGGARVALRLALAYPDVFRGALLNAGSDPLDAGPPTPPATPLLHQFQQGSRIVYVTGEDDKAHVAMDADSEQSLRRWCVFDYSADITPHTGHQVADAAAFARALHALASAAPPAAAKLADCNAALEKKVAEQLQQVAALIASGRRPEAQKALTEIDRHAGGLAAPQSLELEDTLGWQFAGGH
jgi:predicted esterase